MTDRERAEIHSALDQIIARHQPYDRPEEPREGKLAGPGFIWPSAEDYEALDSDA